MFIFAAISKIMKITRLIFIGISLLLLSCKSQKTEVEVVGKRIAISDTITPDQEITDFIEPYREHLNSTLDSALAYNPELLSKSDGDLNTAIGNLMADIVFEQANPVFQQRFGKNIDLVLLNKGGIRSVIPAGKVSARTAYEVMPFENEIVIVELTGKKIKEMLSYLERSKQAHPVSKIQITASRDYKIKKAEIDGEPIKEDKTYFVATSDYLYNGGDNMNFFANPVKLYKVDYKIRNAMIDYFTKVDTIKAQIDNRYIRE